MAAKSKKPGAKAKRPKPAMPPEELWSMMYCFALAGSFSPTAAADAASHGLAAMRAKFSTAEAVGQ